MDPTGPTGGSFLAALINSPNLEERWHQGGYIGYTITAVGIFARLQLRDDKASHLHYLPSVIDQLVELSVALLEATVRVVHAGLRDELAELEASYEAVRAELAEFEKRYMPAVGEREAFRWPPAWSTIQSGEERFV